MAVNADSSRTATRRVAVIGGGLSGLAAAHRLIEFARDDSLPIAVTLFEAGDRPGGVIGTERIAGYLVERGADSFITDKPWAVDLCRRLGLEDELIPTDETYRRSLVLRKGRPVPVPDGFMLLAPAKLRPLLTSPVFSLLGKLRLGWEYFVPRRADKGDESLASFVRRRFGRQALDRLVQPLVGGIYTSDPEKLSLQATMPRFLDMEREHRSLIRGSRKQALKRSEEESSGSGARYGLFATLRRGLSTLVDALTREIIERGCIQLRVEIARIVPPTQVGSDNRREWQVITADGSTSPFDAVIVAVRAYQAAELVTEFDVPLGEALREIEYASTSIVVSGYSLGDIRHPLDAFGLVVPAIENRKILAVSFSSRKFPGRAPDGKVLLRTFVGGAMQPELFELDDDAVTQVVRDELEEMLGITGKPDFTIVARYRNAMPQYHVGHLDRVAEIESLAAMHSGLALAGNAFRGVGIPDCIHSGETAAERVASGQRGTGSAEQEV